MELPRLLALLAVAASSASRRSRAVSHLAQRDDTSTAQRGEWLAVTCTDATYLRILENWLVGYRRAAGPRWRLAVVADDAEAFAGATRLVAGRDREAVVAANRSAAVGGSHAYGSPAFAALMRRRPLQILDALATSGAGVFFTDADAVWTGDPLAIVDRRGYAACDVVVTDQNNGCAAVSSPTPTHGISRRPARRYNPGVLFARNSGGSRRLLDAWAARFDGDSVNLVKFNQAVQKEPAVKVCGLSASSSVLDGRAFKKGRAPSKSRLDAALVVHVNWTPEGLDQKVATLRRLGLWWLDSSPIEGGS
jgi:hypothetical protein